MNKLSVAALGVCLALAAQMAAAQTPAEAELLSAQKAYQEILRGSQSQKNTLASKEAQLATAKQRLTEIQTSISQLETEVSAAQTAQATTNQALQDAGARLDAAWSAVRR